MLAGLGGCRPPSRVSSPRRPRRLGATRPRRLRCWCSAIGNRHPRNGRVSRASRGWPGGSTGSGSAPRVARRGRARVGSWVWRDPFGVAVVVGGDASLVSRSVRGRRRADHVGGPFSCFARGVHRGLFGDDHDAHDVFDYALVVVGAGESVASRSHAPGRRPYLTTMHLATNDDVLPPTVTLAVSVGWVQPPLVSTVATTVR